MKIILALAILISLPSFATDHHYEKNVSDGNVAPDATACDRGIDDAIETALDALVALN